MTLLVLPSLARALVKTMLPDLAFPRTSVSMALLVEWYASATGDRGSRSSSSISSSLPSLGMTPRTAIRKAMRISSGELMVSRQRSRPIEVIVPSPRPPRRATSSVRKMFGSNGLEGGCALSMRATLLVLVPEALSSPSLAKSEL